MPGELEPVGAELVAELRKSGSFGVRVGDEVVRLDRLTVLELGAVQRQTGLDWFTLCQAPTSDLIGALALVEACEAHVEAPRTGAAVTLLELLERFVRLPALEVVQDQGAQPGAQ